jgi:sterol desaturase/sphingolipid hydroxylase (fatty acid hydroxylase superfamily)
VLDALMRPIETVQGAVFQTVIEPALYALGLMDWSEDAFDGVEFVLFGGLAVLVAYAVCRPLELWWPIEPRGATWRSRRAVRADIVYTLVHRIGVVPLFLFLLLNPIGTLIDGTLRFHGVIPPALEQMVPVLAGRPFATFIAYVAIIDCGEYWRHRLQHRLGWWWALHSLHHDQRRMTLWSDDRNHLIDDLLAAMWSATLALMIGVEPGEFPLVLILFRLVESLSHANVRLGFGRIGTALLVGPQFHRTHHAIDHAAPPFDRRGGCNFAVILPLWDILFGTWNPAPGFPPTGLGGVEADCGYLRHQLAGLRRFAAAVRHALDRRRPGFRAALRPSARTSAGD